MRKQNLALLCGVPPTCDRCAIEDAKVIIPLPDENTRILCEKCISELVQRGLDSLIERENAIASGVEHFLN